MIREVRKGRGKKNRREWFSYDPRRGRVVESLSIKSYGNAILLKAQLNEPADRLYYVCVNVHSSRTFYKSYSPVMFATLFSLHLITLYPSYRLYIPFSHLLTLYFTTLVLLLKINYSCVHIYRYSLTKINNLISLIWILFIAHLLIKYLFMIINNELEQKKIWSKYRVVGTHFKRNSLISN